MQVAMTRERERTVDQQVARGEMMTGKQRTFVAGGERCHAGSVTELAGRLANDGLVRLFKDGIQRCTERRLGIEFQALWEIHQMQRKESERERERERE